MLLWVLIGAAALSLSILAFWDSIREWLNNTAANAVEKVLGYNARVRMHKAIVKIDRLANVIRNRTIIFAKPHRLSTMIDEVDITQELNTCEISNEVLREIQNRGVLAQEFEYRTN